MEPYLIDRKITCPDGTVRIGFTQEVGAKAKGQAQKGSWTVVSGTGALNGYAEAGKARPCTAQTPHRPFGGDVNRDPTRIEIA